NRSSACHRNGPLEREEPCQAPWSVQSYRPGSRLSDPSAAAIQQALTHRTYRCVRSVSCRKTGTNLPARASPCLRRAPLPNRRLEQERLSRTTRRPAKSNRFSWHKLLGIVRAPERNHSSANAFSSMRKETQDTSIASQVISNPALNSCAASGADAAD